jgi:PBSX family phage terminase large subunit
MGLCLSSKQNEFIRKAHSRWNFKIGAVRSGKSYEDIAYQIISEIRSRAGLDGLNVILGVSKSTIERNVLKPMREIYTEALVGNINSNNIAMIAGEEVYCLGAEKISQVAKIQGASIKYCYGDEVAKWNEEVFIMLKSRLDKAYSRFDGSCNPEDPNHWLKAFIDDENLDKYVQHYTIFDNPFLPKEFVDNLCKEYAGTIYYDRFIEGKWTRAEGIIFRRFADNPNEYILAALPESTKFSHINIGVDFGGNGSSHTFVATGFCLDYTTIVLESKRIEGTTSPEELDKEFITFVKMVMEKYSKYDLNPRNRMRGFFMVFADSAEQVLIRGLKIALQRNNIGISIVNARKMEIKQRIELLTRMFGLNKLYFLMGAKTAIAAYQTAVWNSKQGHEEERLDDGSTDIDTCDATEYSIEPDYKIIIARLGG